MITLVPGEVTLVQLEQLAPEPLLIWCYVLFQVLFGRFPSPSLIEEIDQNGSVKGNVGGHDAGP